ncbi:periplasmic heavy metal sensor [Pikeienuella piscinae]|uniref:Periplasmic heavy metal sensor n=1 Tax=Pikeienuella piscinae TaxID=2748098 RepID=A0A7L5C222_9RHOB|nr:periplasmic heavy metal sensor [Pikeienuella piscinae]QIE55909.1 periplasmic heavy metal sensor [Pikeienuella piscinae]
MNDNGDNGNARVFGLTPRAARWGLGLSLAANFLVLGLIGGMALKMGDDGRKGPRFHFSEQVVNAAGPERRDAVRALVQQPRDREEQRAAKRARWERMVDLIAKSPFDAGALSAAFDDSDKRRAAYLEERNAAMVKALALLTDDERAALASELRFHLERRAARD